MENFSRPKCLPELQHSKYITVMLSIWSWPEHPDYVRVVFTSVTSQWKMSKILIMCEPLKSLDPQELSESLISLIHSYQVERILSSLVLANFTSEKQDKNLTVKSKIAVLLEKVTEILQKRGLSIPSNSDKSESFDKPIMIIKTDIIRSYLESEKPLSPKLAAFKTLLDYWEGSEKDLDSSIDFSAELIQYIETNRRLSNIDSHPFTWTVPLLLLIFKQLVTGKIQEQELKAFIKEVLTLVDPFYTAMAVLDPRFNSWHDAVEYQNKLMTAVSKAQSLSLLSFSPTDNIQLEVFKYLGETAVPKGMTPLQYWQSRQNKLPILSQLSQCFLPISYAIVTENNLFQDKTDEVLLRTYDDDSVAIIDS